MKNKEDIYVIMSDVKLLHAVKTKRQAQLFVSGIKADLLDMGIGVCDISSERLHYHKIKLFRPRVLSEKQKLAVKIALQGEPK